MNRLLCIILLQCATTLILGQVPEKSKPAGTPNQPEALVRSFYTELVARHPIGIPGDADMKVFAPYLSTTLLRKIDIAVACGKDWYRQHSDPNMKPEFGWLETGLFSGEDEEASPQAFDVQKARPEKDGSFRVYVRLSRSEPHEKPLHWRVAAIVVRENGHSVIDDVVFPKTDRDPEMRLSKDLSAGCNGPHWVGYGDR